MAHLARPPCSSSGCTRKATARVRGKWLCGKHAKAPVAPVAVAARR